ncbi:peptidase [Nostoc linckia z18]|jgi:beta-barrel assembly-enhancing protease|uniref:Peptidase n=3 Tax=Nostoc TaxID=1177 RepID=A0A9Q5Z4D8_NOSLI|nr:MULTISPECIES: M48 family metalloprotease [Nostoc]PHK37211.1 peptidase [Nostoc linckia z15]PHK43546.1 peptidase [Nostoc linckia z16]MBC1239890.1 M48 family metallopeptidase [Nostoc sp. 2RC]MBD2612236.1 M48 family metallopeptidase [Nostoc punctiforme FACHB-252]PHJ56438.1 peptidase [Nostoc linckia z1]
MLNWKGFVVNYRTWRRRWFYPLISVVVALSLCLGTALPGRTLEFLPLILQGVQVLQLSNISDRQETDIGKQINQEIIGSQVRLYKNAGVNSYVEQIGRRLAANSDRPNLSYTFQVVEDNAINAFATLGGYVYVHTGLLKAADNEAELASVIAHEIGHIGGKHLVKQMRQRAIASGLATATGLDRNTAINIGVELALNRPRSRQDEYDADKRGLKTLTRAGYAQSAMVSFMQKLLKQGGSVPTFLSTHPGTSDRIANLKRAIESQPSNGTYGLDSASYRANIRPLA